MTAERKWTPGPWQVSGVRHTSAPKIGKDTRLLAVGPDGDAVAMVFFDMKTGRGHHDAHLIAAAPRLYAATIIATSHLAAAIRLLRAVGNNAAPSDKMFDQMLADHESAAETARAALAKAEGNQ